MESVQASRENIARLVRGCVVAGLSTAGIIYGSQLGVERYARSFDEPQLISRMEVRVERLRDGRIHIYQRVEKHEYFAPYLMQEFPQAKPVPPEEKKKEQVLPDQPPDKPSMKPKEYGKLAQVQQ